MRVDELCFACARAVVEGQNITLSLPKGSRWPSGFPRGELLSVGTSGHKNCSFNPVRVLAWVQDTTATMKAIHGGFQVTPNTKIAVERSPAGGA